MSIAEDLEREVAVCRTARCASLVHRRQRGGETQAECGRNLSKSKTLEVSVK
jgi:hypothetical protein